MTADSAINLGMQALTVAVDVGGPLLAASLLIGLIVSVFQAATQIQEQMLTLIPKLVGIVLVIIVLGPWMLDRLTSYATSLYSSIPTLVG
ncbi:MAG TPA: flagellar biosynthesis protein FliQ [Solirubrobacteraceae bacterium]|nr:flagellar biosynthesis protein FliQ [Solirubrobacteraceae bacterium]